MDSVTAGSHHQYRGDFRERAVERQQQFFPSAKLAPDPSMKIRFLRSYRESTAERGFMLQNHRTHGIQG
jgi:hypothetical protein